MKYYDYILSTDPLTTDIIMYQYHSNNIATVRRDLLLRSVTQTCRRLRNLCAPHTVQVLVLVLVLVGY